jgi:hypothetical protein
MFLPSLLSLTRPCQNCLLVAQPSRCEPQSRRELNPLSAIGTSPNHSIREELQDRQDESTACRMRAGISKDPKPPYWPRDWVNQRFNTRRTRTAQQEKRVECNRVLLIDQISENPKIMRK